MNHQVDSQLQIIFMWWVFMDYNNSFSAQWYNNYIKTFQCQQGSQWPLTTLVPTHLTDTYVAIHKLYVLAKLQCMRDPSAQVSYIGLQLVMCMSIIQSNDEPKEQTWTLLYDLCYNRGKNLIHSQYVIIIINYRQLSSKNFHICILNY